MGRPDVSEKSWIVEFYEKEGDGREEFWVRPRESWLINSSYDHEERCLQRPLEDIIAVFAARWKSVGTYWKHHTWRFRNLNTGEVIPWEVIE